ncbi:hypothetical protein GLAREA_07637 [Glarea lozoyensis ATCC 20868]|uniref:Uncharacterized protein n=1 Tax=Glarea lozoyensis (strain ATCC 20868 / MF5171) TaxID=1116229 RepID=S3E1Y5_GLAL2|nr:uncharacterized protein GLAREA_07637 [Glarea lozoyensis ATCC 20868]EPE32503.1 hypothetical protein GLAREA_07637 [Glarea lozoyensis ATCC 20868]
MPANAAPARTTLPRSRTPLVVSTIVVGSVFFIGMKWRAVIARSEAAKHASSKDNLHVVAGERSGGGV